LLLLLLLFAIADGHVAGSVVVFVTGDIFGPRGPFDELKVCQVPKGTVNMKVMSAMHLERMVFVREKSREK